MPKGNPHRCRVCGCLGGSDGYCKNCREKISGSPTIPLVRPTFKQGFALEKPHFVSDEFGAIKDKFGIERDDFS